MEVWSEKLQRRHHIGNISVCDRRAQELMFVFAKADFRLK